GEDCEIVVVDDGSTDRTAEIAATLGARVVRVDVRHIAAARNAGARAAVGGGSTVRMASGHARWAEQMMAGASWFMRTARWAAGCFVFARRDAFEQVGGFDERYFASEEIHLSRALKRRGRFVIIADAVITSGRKADAFSFTE